MGGIVSILDLLCGLEKQMKSRSHSEKPKLGLPKTSDEKKNEQMQILLSFRQLKFSCPRADEKCVTRCPVCSCLLDHFAGEPAKPASGSRRMENNM